MNEYGSREDIVAALQRQPGRNSDSQKNPFEENSNSNPFTKTATKGNEPKKLPTQGNAATSSLNKLFTLNSTELKGPSPNKLFIFKYRNKK